MARTRRLFVLLFAAAAGLLWAPTVSAQCGTSQPFGHFRQGYIELCRDDKPVDGYVTAMGSSAVTADSNIICESADDVGVQGGSCQTAAGTLGDGRITVSGNFANPGSLGCPDPNGLTGVGRNIYTIRDGNGGGLMITVGYDPILGLYAVDNAHKADANGNTLPLQCQPKALDAASGFATGGQIMHLDGITGTPPVAQVTLYHPTVFSDCDPDSVGTFKSTGSCDPASDAGGILDASGNFFVTTASCRGAVPARTVCNGGSKAGQPCLAAFDCAPSLVACVARWKPAGTPVDPTVLPATTSIPIPVNACNGGSNPEAPCSPATQLADCGGRCNEPGAPRDGIACTSSVITGPCQGRCTAGTVALGTQCTSATVCGTGGVCTAWPCALGTCAALTTFTNQCAYIGTTLTFNGSESTSIMTTPIALGGGGPGAPSARALDVTAAVSGGNVKIHFRTAAELQLVGFNVLTETKTKGTFKVSSSMIAPTGVGGGGATYDVAVGRGSFQGGRTVIIESVLSDNTTLRSDAAKF